jgi:hypothetical protein
MAAQNTVELGFDIPVFDKEKKHIADGLVEIYELGKKLGANLIPVGSSGGWTELTNKVKAQQQALKDLQDANVKLAQSIASNAKAQAASTKATTDDQKAKQAMLKTEQEVIKTITLEDKATQQSIKTKKEALTYEQALQREKDKGLKQSQAEAKLADQLADDYIQLNKALKDQEIRYRNLALTKGFDNQATQDALKEALNTRAVLDKVDGNLRNYQRNVGNYKSAFDGLGMSFGQVARELPSLAINFQTFALAISNNLPMVFDEVAKARSEIKAMRAEGQEVPGLFSRLARSVFSLNVLMSVAITLFTLFSKQLFDGIKGLFGFTDAEVKAAEAGDRMLQVYTKILRAQKELNELEYGARNGLSNAAKMENELRVLQSLNKSRGDQLELELKIADARAAEASTLFVTSGGFQTLADKQLALTAAEIEYNTLLRDQAQITTEEGRKSLDAEIQRSERRLENAKYEASEAKRIVEESIQAIKDSEIKANELRIYREEEARKKSAEIIKAQAQDTIDANERVLNDERKFEAARVAALQQAAAARKKIVQAELSLANADPSNTDASGTPTAALVAARKQAGLELVKIERDTQESIFNTREEFRKRRVTAELAIAQAETEFNKARYEEAAQDESQSLGERVEAYAAFVDAERDLLDKDFEYQKATKIMTNEELLALQAEYGRKLKELAVRSRKDIAEIFVSAQMEELEEVRSIENLKLSEEQLALYKRLKNKDKFAIESAKLDKKYQRDALNDAIFVDKEIIANTKTTEQQKKDAQQRVRDNQAKLNALDLEDTKKMDAQKQALKDVYYQLELKGVETFFSLATILANNYYQRRIEQIQEERKLLDENYAKDVENINNSSISQQEKAAQLQILEVQNAAKRQELLNKENAEKIKQAKLEKTIAIGRIIAETAIAVVHALTTGDPYTAIARAALAGATGAAQLATVIATPIPSYAEGTDNHPGGPARYGEDGPEAVKEPGKPWRMVDTETISNLARGTQVVPLTADRVLSAAGGAMIANIQEREAAARLQKPDRIGELIAAVTNTGRMTERALRKQKSPVVNLYNNGRHGDWVTQNIKS